MISLDDTAPLPSDEPPEKVAVWVIDPTFPLGQMVITPAAMVVLEEARLSPFEFIIRHGNADWGDLCDEDKQSNADALEHGERLFSCYKLDETTKLYVITERDRSVTTVLLPSDY